MGICSILSMGCTPINAKRSMGNIMWRNSQVSSFSYQSVVELIGNKIPAVRIENFATETEVTDFQNALLQVSLHSKSVKQVTRLGISQYEQGIRSSKLAYFDLAEKAWQQSESVFSSSFSPLDRMLNCFSDIGIDAAIMEEPGFGKYFAGTGKLRSGDSPIHVDFAPQDSEDWLIGKSEAQLAWNFYLKVADQGEELLLWDKLWQREDDRYQVEDNYYYTKEVVEDARLLKLPVHAGEVVLINSRNFHAVAESKNRLAYGSFISVFPSVKLCLWS